MRYVIMTIQILSWDGCKSHKNDTWVITTSHRIEHHEIRHIESSVQLIMTYRTNDYLTRMNNDYQRDIVLKNGSLEWYCDHVFRWEWINNYPVQDYRNYDPSSRIIVSWWIMNRRMDGYSSLKDIMTRDCYHQVKITSIIDCEWRIGIITR